MREIRTTSNDEELVYQRRQTIAAGALQVFLEKGYDKATMRDVGKACGMTHGNLYNYVGSKADILQLILINNVRGASKLRDFRSELGDVSCAKVLAECMTIYLRDMDSIRRPLRFFDREIYTFSREDRDMALASEMEVVSFFEELFKEGIEAGEFQVRNPTLLAHDILMYGHDWAVRGWFLKQHVTLEEYIEERVRLVLELVTTRTSQTAETSWAQSATQIPSDIDGGT